MVFISYNIKAPPARYSANQELLLLKPIALPDKMGKDGI